MHKSEIRDNTIASLTAKAQKRNYHNYLCKVNLKKLRGFSDEPITFDFPVTAIVGPNGGGKTTILGAAACAYKPIQPRQFFSKSGVFDQTMQNWSIEYEVIDRQENKKDVIRRTATFSNLRWKRDALTRPVLLFGVSRTVPAIERKELSRCVSSRFTVPSARIEELAASISKAVSQILARDVTGFKRIKVDAAGRVTMLTGKTTAGTEYSEFHFGAGESSIIRMISQIESSPDQSLVLIEEIENGLHPVATTRLVEYLIEVAERKSIQTIFTTHSNAALVALPSNAVWVATQDRIFQGKLDIQSLRAITGQISAKLAVFVEDNFAKLWVQAMLRCYGAVAIDAIEVHAMEGDGTALKVHTHHRNDPAAKTVSVCIIDGDSRQTEDPTTNVFRLPGSVPETYVFDQVLQKSDQFGGKLAVALLQRYEESDKVVTILKEVRITNRDPHLLFAQVGERLGLLPESTIVGAFTSIWSQAYSDDVTAMLGKLKSLIPMEHTQA